VIALHFNSYPEAKAAFEALKRANDVEYYNYGAGMERVTLDTGEQIRFKVNNLRREDK
jgi:hypothetical protein